MFLMQRTFSIFQVNKVSLYDLDFSLSYTITKQKYLLEHKMFQM